MKNKYGIGIFAVIIIGVFAIVCVYQLAGQRTQEKVHTEIQEKPMDHAEETVTTDGHALKEDCFYLMEVNGYIVVYLSDKKTPYEYTDILCEKLPESLRNEIRNGKYVENQDELYGILENYSS